MKRSNFHARQLASLPAPQLLQQASDRWNIDSPYSRNDGAGRNTAREGEEREDHLAPVFKLCCTCLNPPPCRWRVDDATRWYSSVLWEATNNTVLQLFDIFGNYQQTCSARTGPSRVEPAHVGRYACGLRFCIFCLTWSLPNFVHGPDRRFERR